MHNIYETSKIYAGHECPTFNLRHVFNRRNKLVAALAAFYDSVLTADQFKSFTAIFYDNLPHVKHNIIDDSLHNLVGRKLQKTTIIDVAWRMAGNLPLLQEGVPVFPWLSQKTIEWVPLVVYNVKPPETGDKIAIIFKVLAGTPCPCVISFTWSEAAIRFFSRKIGFTSNRGGRALGYYTNIVGMLFAGCLIPALSATQPTFPFDGVHCTASMLSNNKQLIDSRCRHKAKCPLNFDWPCYNCFIGRDKCKRAIRLITEEEETDAT
jgi:hypothetical protein